MSVRDSFQALSEQLDVDASIEAVDESEYKISHNHYDVSVQLRETGLVAADRAQVNEALRRLKEFEE